MTPYLVVALCAQVPTQQRPTAVSSTKEMYDFWCKQPVHATGVVCKQRDLGRQVATSDPQLKKPLLAELTALNKRASAVESIPGGGSRTVIAKEYAQMKMAFCSESGSAKSSLSAALCSSAASRYVTPPAMAKSPSNSTSQPVVDWYCAKPVHDADYCKRQQIYKSLRQPNLSADARKAYLADLKSVPQTPIAITQAIFTDFCKVPAHMNGQICLNVRRTQQQQKMAKWFCGHSANEENIWCKRMALMDKMKALPADALTMRATLNNQMTVLMKNKSMELSAAIQTAKKAFCAQASAEDKGFCSGPAALTSQRPPVPVQARLL